ncbi:MAG: hypothetical protein M3340_13600 [Actinomycetota bacterium]|nr:hypothetical protein [Actinomycetota bacterium]
MEKARPDSVALSLSDVSDASAQVSMLQERLSQRPDSLMVSVRGERSAVVHLLERVRDQSLDVSARIRLRGDAPAGG